MTNLDTSFFDTTPTPTDLELLASKKRKAIASQNSGIERKAGLDSFVAGNCWIWAFYAPHIFEVDLVSAGNVKAFVQTSSKTYKAPHTINEAEEAL